MTDKETENNYQKPNLNKVIIKLLISLREKNEK